MANEPTTQGRDAGELKFDYPVTPFFSNVCERFLESSWSTVKDGVLTSALDPKSLD